MRISHQHKFIFLSNPQSGSSSIRASLGPFSDIRSSTEPPYVHHINARILRAHFREKGWNWNAYFKFTTIRNPWDKMVSRYHFGLKKPNSFWHEHAKNARDFSDFVNHPEVLRVSSIFTIERFAFAEDGKCLVDHILKLEDINQELPQIFKRAGLPEIEISKKNSTPRNHYSSYYDQETKAKVEAIYALDVQYGNYIFEEENSTV